MRSAVALLSAALVVGAMILVVARRQMEALRPVAPERPARATPPEASLPAVKPSAPVLPTPAERPPRAADSAQAPAAAEAETVQALFDRGWSLEQDRLDWKGAIGCFKGVYLRQEESRLLAARALFEIGLCLEKMRRPKEAHEAFDKTAREFADQGEVAERARVKLGTEDEFKEDAALTESLRATRIDLEFVNADAKIVASMIREKIQVNLIIDGAVAEGLEGKLFTDRLIATTVADALDRIFGPLDLAWRVEHQSVVILKKETGCGPTKPDPLPDWEADWPAWRVEQEALAEKLNAAPPIDFHSCATPIVDAARQLQERTQMQFVVDEASIPNLSSDQVTLRADTLPAGLVLDLLMKTLQLDWYADQGVVHITTREAAAAYRKRHE